ncbi:MAG TPA: hypothetical protein VGN07_07295 [Steroidobacteraceae bacterium]|jgi:hypothetical protein
MIKSVLVGVALLAAGSSGASSKAIPESEKSLVGVWELSQESKERFIPECRGMQLEFTADGYLTRKTGELVYTTRVEVVPAGERYRLVEHLESENGAHGCGGKDASFVIEHLKINAYVRSEGDHLFYYRSRNRGDFIAFNRVAAS